LKTKYISNIITNVQYSEADDIEEMSIIEISTAEEDADTYCDWRPPAVEAIPDDVMEGTLERDYAIIT